MEKQMVEIEAGFAGIKIRCSLMKVPTLVYNLFIQTTQNHEKEKKKFKKIFGLLSLYF